MSRVSMRRVLLADLVRLPATAVRFLAEALRWVILAPIARGHLRLGGQSAGVKALAVVSVLLGAVLVALVPGARAIRSVGELAVVVTAGSVLSVPRSTIWLFVLALALVVAMLQAAAMHSTLWFRLSVFVTVAIMLLFVGSIDATDGMSPGMWVAVGALVALSVLEILRWRREPRWWEPLVVLVIVMTVFAVVYLRSADVAQAFGIDRSPLVTGTVIRQFRLLAVPLSIFAGVAVAKVALSGMTFASDFSARRLSSPTLVLLTFSVLGWRLVTLISTWYDEMRVDAATTLRRLGGGGATVAVVLLGWWTTQRLLDRADAHERARTREVDDEDEEALRSATTVEGIVGHLDDVALPVSIVLGILIIPTFLAALGGQVSLVLWGADAGLTEALVRILENVTGDAALRWTRILGAVGILGFGLWLGRRGRRGMAELTTVIGAWILMHYLTDAEGLLAGWSTGPGVIDRLGVIAITAVAVVWARQRTLSADRLGAVLLVALVSSLLGERDFVSSPLTAIIGTSGIALVLFGFVWNFLADADKASADTPGFPRESRVLLFLSQTLFGLVVLAWVAVSRDASSGLDLSQGSALGDAFIGVPLLIVVWLTIANTAVSHGELGDAPVRADAIDMPFAETVDAVERTMEDVLDDVVAGSDTTDPREG